MSHDKPDTADGTQPSGPSSVFADPLAGLTTDAESGSGGGFDRVSHGVTRPAAPDPDSVRSRFEGMFASESEATDDSDSAEPEPDETSDGDGAPLNPVHLPTEGDPPGILPAQRRTWPIRRRLTRQAWRPRARPGRREQKSPRRAPPSLKPTRGVTGVAVAFALLAVFCFVALLLVVSFVDMFT